MFATIYGVDFSGARQAGRNIWVARLERQRARRGKPRYRLAELAGLEKLCGSAERGPALDYLVGLIADSHEALWALDFPFGLPLEVLDPGTRWPGQLDLLRAWGDDAYGSGWSVYGGPRSWAARTTSAGSPTPRSKPPLTRIIIG
jgi:hypothetical protein